MSTRVLKSLHTYKDLKDDVHAQQCVCSGKTSPVADLEAFCEQEVKGKAELSNTC